MKYDGIKRVLNRTLEDEEFSYRIHTSLIAGLFSTIGLSMFILNLLLKNSFLTLVTAIITTVGIVSFTYVYKTTRYTLVRNILSATFIVALIYFLYSGSGEGTVPFWAILLPFMSYFLFGLKKGAILTMTFLLMSIIMLWLPFEWLLAYDYTNTFRLRFPIIYFAAFVAATGTESIRFMTRSKLEETVEYLESVTWVDALTEIDNRRSFERHLSEIWGIFAGKENYISIIMIDIDYFKKYNDAYGHLKGDDALKEVASILASVITLDMGFVARWGGEEFICLLPFCDPIQSINIGKSILDAINKAQIVHEFTDLTNKYISVSVGTATVNATAGIDPKDVIKGADESLYEAKQFGRNRLGRNRIFG